MRGSRAFLAWSRYPRRSMRWHQMASTSNRMATKKNICRSPKKAARCPPRNAPENMPMNWNDWLKP